MTCSTFQAELSEHIPVFQTSIAGTRLVGRLSVGEWWPRKAGDVANQI